MGRTRRAEFRPVILFFLSFFRVFRVFRGPMLVFLWFGAVTPPVPPVQHPTWPRNAVDRFILAKLEANGLAPSTPADRRTLIRRVTFDLTGLPPTPAEVAAFENASAAKPQAAYAELVDRLLAS